MTGRPVKKQRPRSAAQKPSPNARRQVPPAMPRPALDSEALPRASAFTRAVPTSAAPPAWRPARVKASSEAGRRPAVMSPSVGPGPGALAFDGRLPALSRVGGAAGTKGALEFIAFRSGAISELRPHAVGVTYWFDAPEPEGSYEVVVRLTGHRLDVVGPRDSADDFVSVASVPHVRSRSGRSSLTHRVRDVPAGRWHVTAEAMAFLAGGDRADGIRLPAAEAVGSSTFAPIATARAPGVVLGAWPAMVGLGVVLALALQSLLVQAHGLPLVRVLGLSLLASVLGALGAKGYYRLTHLREKGGQWLTGLSVQGFVVVATVTFVVGGALLGLPIGHLLDATVPALLLGQAVGRLGCLFGGCCAGVPTRSRWAVWSSDRNVGTRRVPVQLLESAAAGTLALVTGFVSWRTSALAPGGLFVAGVAAYVVVRQVLFPLRGMPRATRHGRTVTLAVATLVLVGSFVVPALA